MFIRAIRAVFPQVLRGSVFEANGFLFYMPVIPNALIYHQSPAFAFFAERASVANKHNGTADVRGLGGQCLCWGPSSLVVFIIKQG